MMSSMNVLCLYQKLALIVIKVIKISPYKLNVILIAISARLRPRFMVVINRCAIIRKNMTVNFYSQYGLKASRRFHMLSGRSGDSAKNVTKLENFQPKQDKCQFCKFTYLRYTRTTRMVNDKPSYRFVPYRIRSYLYLQNRRYNLINRIIFKS